IQINLHGNYVYLFPTNYIDKKGETIGIVFEEDNINTIVKISIDNQIEYPIYNVKNNIIYSLVGIPHTIVTNFSIIITLSNRITSELEEIEIPFEVNIDPIKYAKRKPKEIKEIEVRNDFRFKTNKYKPVEEYESNIQVFLKPIEGEIRDGYGVNRSRGGILYGRIHLGIDILREIGAKIYPTWEGIVTSVSKDKKAGKYITIYHGYGIFSVYMHLSKTFVEKGQRVSTNDIIGLVGSTGMSTGPHLHFGISINNIYVDPISFLERDYSYSNILSNGMKISITNKTKHQDISYIAP
ncbi:MAG: M23 family metallopeptidase, partial [Brevinematia bacterium]